MLGGLLHKENVWRMHRRAGDVEEESKIKIVMLTAHDNNNGYILWGIYGGAEGTTNAPRIIVIQ